MLLSGKSHVAYFQVVEEAERVSVTISRNGQREFVVCGEVSNSLPATSLFPSLEQASIFFQQGPLGLSATGQPGCFDAVELQCENWNPIAMNVSRVESSYFDDHTIFPPGSVEFDSALLVRNVVHRWCRRSRVGKPAKFPVVEAISPVQRARASRSMPRRAILLDAEKE